MKAELETKALTHRGVILRAETEEEAQVLKTIWEQHGRPVSIAQIKKGSIELTIAPTPEGEHDQI